MLFLKYLLMWGGIGMISAAAGILAYDLYLEIQYRKALASAGAGPLPAGSACSLAGSARARDAGLGADTAGAGHRRSAQRHGRGSCQPDQRDASRNALSRRALS